MKKYFSLPISVTISNVTITILNIIQNKKFDCKSCYSFQHREICSERKDCNIIPTKMLCGTEVEIVVSNMSNSCFGLYDHSCKIVDCSAFSYSNQYYCSDFQIARYEYSFGEILPKTKARGFLLFPELENDVWISQIVIKSNLQDTFVFDIEKFNQTIQDEIESVREQEIPSGSDAVTLHSIQNEITHLKELIFRRLNNVLQAREKVSLENSIKNTEFHIRLLMDSLSENYKKEVDEELENILYDYLSCVKDVSTVLPKKTHKEGARPDLGDTIFRSAWEANIARILNRKGIAWEYEKERIELNNIAYLPDFFIGKDTIMEVKGFWDIDSADKVDVFIRTYPNKTMLIVDADMYVDLEKIYTTYSPIPNWESTISLAPTPTSVAVVGITFLEDKSVIQELSIGDSLTLKREFNNEYDKYAIAVKTKEGKMIGHMEKRFATIYSKKIELGMTFSVIVTEIKKKAIIVSINRNNFDTLVLYDTLRPN